MKTRVVLFVLAAAFAGAATASAQLRGGTVEINPFAGYLFGGTIDHNSDHGFRFSRVDVDDDVTYGGRIGYNLTSLLEFETQYSRTETQFVSRQRDVDDQKLGDLNIDYFLAYATFNFGHGRVVPYFTIGAGGANLVPNVLDTRSTSEVRFTSSVGGGVKIFVTPHFGFRLDGRGYSTWLGDDSHVYCNTASVCTNQNWLTNGEGTGGFIIAF
ncbi:MAG: outer membrane beta-barrel protein [Acidobacteriota bacterium]